MDNAVCRCVLAYTHATKALNFAVEESDWTTAHKLLEILSQLWDLIEA